MASNKNSVKILADIIITIFNSEENERIFNHHHGVPAVFGSRSQGPCVEKLEKAAMATVGELNTSSPRNAFQRDPAGFLSIFHSSRQSLQQVLLTWPSQYAHIGSALATCMVICLLGTCIVSCLDYFDSNITSLLAPHAMACLLKMCSLLRNGTIMIISKIMTFFCSTFSEATHVL